MTSGSDGSFSFSDIEVGTYKLQPVHNGYGFTPDFRIVTVPPDAAEQNFTANLYGHKPASKEKLTASKVTFSWDAIPDAVKYRIQLSTLPDFSLMLLDIKTTEPTYFFDSFLRDNKIYYWRIRPIYTDSKSPWLPTWQFTSMNPLVKPTLVSPQHKEILTISDATLKWIPVENAVLYKVVIATDALFINKVEKLKTDEISAVFNLPDGKYFWRVRALDPYSAKGPWSDYRIFKVSVP
jgi:hypothetical protein